MGDAGGLGMQLDPGGVGRDFDVPRGG